MTKGTSDAVVPVSPVSPVTPVALVSPVSPVSPVVPVSTSPVNVYDGVSPRWICDGDEGEDCSYTYPAPVDPSLAPKIRCYDYRPSGNEIHCNVGYRSMVENPNSWKCGADCVGGKNYTDDRCKCACIPAAQCI